MAPTLDRLKLSFQSIGKRKVLWSWIAKYVAVFVVFLALSIPAQSRLSAMSSQVSSLNSQIEDSKKMSVGLLNPAELEALQARLQKFESKLVDAAQAEKLADEISEEAEKNHLNVIQIYSDNPVPVKDAVGKDLEVGGKKLNLLPVNFRVETGMKNFADFLKALSDHSKGAFVVETMQLQKTSAETDTLQCDITLSYLVR